MVFMENLLISQKVQQKLQEKHHLTVDDVRQCFANREGGFLVDSRDEHKTDPPTLWFIAENFYGRLIKVVFVPTADGKVSVKTAYEPNQLEISLYRSKARI
jgi:hypothetical protein